MAAELKIKRRKVIHTQSVIHDRQVLTTATCNDGTMWQISNAKGAKWVQVLDVPG